MLGRQHQQGITIIELVVTLFIIAALIIIAIPVYINYVQQNQLIGVTQNLYYALQYARSEAIKRNTTVYVNLITGSNWCYGINPGTACTCSTAGSCTLGSTQSQANEAISFTNTGVTSNTITFEPNHGAAYVTGFLTFTLTGKSTAMTVTVNIQGDLQICSSQVSGYPVCL